MMRQVLRVSMLAGAVAALPTLAAAQSPSPAPSSTIQDRWPQAAPPPTQQQQQPQQQSVWPQTQPQQQQPQQQPQQAPPSPRRAQPNVQDDDAPARRPAAKPRPAAAPTNAVTCSAPFTKDTNHLKLSIKFESRNVTYGDVDGPDGSKLKATIIYPNEGRRRLEVMWNNDTARTDLSVVVINGQSQWSAPRGVKLGATVAALEKLNGRPFKIGGFGPDGHASVLGWEGGALSSLPGGCRIGIRLTANGSASQSAREAASGSKEFTSSNAAIKSLSPTVTEILIGF